MLLGLEKIMGNIRRLNKSLNKGIALAKTGITFGGSQVCLLSGDTDKAQAFKQSCMRNAYRASLMNVTDMYMVSASIRDKALKGGPIWN